MENQAVDRAPLFSAAVCDVCKKQDEHLRIVALPYVFSFIFFTGWRSFAGIYCKKHYRLHLMLASLITATIGWLGIPWGLIRTPLALYRLARGGDMNADLNFRLLTQLADKFLQQGDTNKAIRCLEQSLRFRDDPQAREKLARSYQAARSAQSAESPGILVTAFWLSGVIMLSALAGTLLGILDMLLTTLVAPLFGTNESLLLGAASWLPWTLGLFLTVLLLRSAVDFALTRGEISSPVLALTLSITAVLLAFFSIIQIQAILSGLTSLGDWFAYSSQDGIFALRSMLFSGGIHYIFNYIEFGETAGLIYAILLLSALLLCLLVCIQSSLQVAGWQGRLASIKDAVEAGMERPSIGAWGSMGAILAGIVLVMVVLFPGRIVNVEAAYVHLDRGLAAVNENDIEGGMYELDQVLRIWPDSVAAHVSLSLAYAHQTELDSAVKELETALSIDPDSLLGTYAMGMVRFERGEYEEAVSMLQKVTAATPEFGTAHVMLGVLYYLQDDLAASQAEIEQAISLAETDENALSDLAYYYEMTRDFEKSEQYIRAAIKAVNDPADYVRYARLVMIKGDLDQAGKIIDEAERLEGKPVDIARARASLAMYQQDLQRAESILTTALHEDPENSDLLGDLSYIHFWLGQYDQAAKYAQAALTANAFNQSAYVDLAFALEAQGQIEEARAAAEQGVKYQPKYDRAHYILGLTYMDSGMNELAIREFETFLELYWERPFIKDYREKAELFLQQLK